MEASNALRIFWTAKNSSSFLNGFRSAKTIRTAVRDARRYVNRELFGEGIIIYYAGNPAEYGREIRVDELSVHTGYHWRTGTLGL
jgi:hypothetical protein